MSQDNNSKKPFLDQIKEAIQNKEQIKEQVIQNLQFAGKIAEAQAKVLLKQAKDSKIFNDQIVPLAGSEVTDKALDVLNTKLKLKNTPLMKNIEKFRKEILETQVAQAKEAKPSKSATSVETAQATEPAESVESTKTTDSSEGNS